MQERGEWAPPVLEISQISLYDTYILYSGFISQLGEFCREQSSCTCINDFLCTSACTCLRLMCLHL